MKKEDKDLEALEASDPEYTTIEKMPFEAVQDVFWSLNMAFHPDGIGDEGVDARFLSLWRLFLCTVGWNEDQYWAISEERDECEDCECTCSHELKEEKKTAAKDKPN